MTDDPHKQKALNDLMHAETRREISDIKKNAEETLRDFLSLKTEVHSINQNLHNLDERLNQGVSKTAFKTYEKVNEISVTLTEMGHKAEKQDLRMDQIESKVETNKSNHSTILKFILGIASLAFTILITLAVWVIKNAGSMGG